MEFKIEFSDEALRDLDDLPEQDYRLMMKRIMQLQSGLVGDILKVRTGPYDFRLRSGDFRAFFEIKGGRVLIHRVLNRKDSY